jgi:hypothetical protein
MNANNVTGALPESLPPHLGELRLAGNGINAPLDSEFIVGNPALAYDNA